MDFIKTNWFKLALIIAIFIYLFLFTYEQKRESRIYNSDLVKWCVIHSDDIGNTELCSKFVEKAKLSSPWKFWEWMK